MKQVCLLLSLTFFIPALAHSQDAVFDVPRLPADITFDGKLDEDFWDELTPLSLTGHMPHYGQAPSEAARIYLCYDDHYLYLAGDMQLSDPGLLRPTTFRRDPDDGTTDYLGLILDSFHDKENALAFFTGPTGFRWDGSVSNDAEGDSPLNLDWNTFWDVLTHMGESHWSSEMRIPWSSLRFQDKDGQVLMGITCWWYIAAKNELVIYPDIPPKWGDMSAWKPSQMQTIRFREVYSKKPLYIAPYLLGGSQLNYDLNETGTAYLKNKEPAFEAGLDVKYGITNNLTLDLTVNTDFAQVEADDQQVNLTRFSLFFPEKRLFFQERAGIFDFNFDQFNRLFYSRRIGLDEDGNPVRIYGGARLVGRVGKYDLGFLNMQTQASDSLASENFGLFRLRRQLSGSNSYIGGILANRMDVDGHRNTALGFDGIFNLNGADFLTAKWAHTFDDATPTREFSTESGRFYLDWERRRFDGLSYKLSISRVGGDYQPEMGFELRNNYHSVAPTLRYGWLLGEKSDWFSWRVSLENYILENYSTRIVETASSLFNIEGTSKNGWYIQAGINYQHEYITEAFELSETATVPTGTYDFFQWGLNVSTPYSQFLGAILEWKGGAFYDGHLQSVAIFPRWKLSAHFDLQGFYQYNYGNFRSRDQLFEAHLARIKAVYMLNTKFSIAAFLQYNSLDKVYVGNVRFRLNPREGHDLYLVYNDLINEDRTREMPHLPFSSNRAVVLKYTYTFSL
ncbi:MAG: DUF5916 domain-containing protein [Saprospiraceae bacterium]